MGLFDFFKRNKKGNSNQSQKTTNQSSKSKFDDASLEDSELLAKVAEFIKTQIQQNKDRTEITRRVQKHFGTNLKQAEILVEKQLESYLRWGSFELNRNSLDGAKGLLSAALHLDPNSKIALGNLGVLYSKFEDYNQSLIYYEKAATLYPDDIQIQENLASTYESLNNVEGAKRCYENILKIDNTNDDAMFGLSQCLIEFGLYEKALVYLDKVIKIGDENALVARYSKIGVLFKVGNKTQSLQLYKEVLQENPDDFHIHQIIPNWLAHDGKVNEAILFYEEQYEKTQNSKLLRLKADFIYHHNKYQAIAAYDEYLEVEPNDAEAIGLQLNLKTEAGEPVDIKKETERILAIDPNNITALHNKLLMLANQKQFLEAIKIGEKLSELQPENLDFIKILIELYGLVYSIGQKFDDAILQIQEKNPDERYNIEYRKGLYLKGEKHYDKAITIFKKLNQEHDFAWNHYQMGIIENLRGNTALCFEHLKKTFQLDPNLKADARQYHELENLRKNPIFMRLVN